MKLCMQTSNIGELRHEVEGKAGHRAWDPDRQSAAWRFVAAGCCGEMTRALKKGQSACHRCN